MKFTDDSYYITLKNYLVFKLCCFIFHKSYWETRGLSQPQVDVRPQEIWICVSIEQQNQTTSDISLAFFFKTTLLWTASY